jgi:hypothetical protein
MRTCVDHRQVIVPLPTSRPVSRHIPTTKTWSRNRFPPTYQTYYWWKIRISIMRSKFPVLIPTTEFSVSFIWRCSYSSTVEHFPKNLEADKCGLRHGLEMLLHSGTFPYIMNIANKKAITSREDSLWYLIMYLSSLQHWLLYVCWRYIPGQQLLLLLQSLLLHSSIPGTLWHPDGLDK